jgi:signal transduction histidine kinase
MNNKARGNKPRQPENSPEVTKIVKSVGLSSLHPGRLVALMISIFAVLMIVSLYSAINIEIQTHEEGVVSSELAKVESIAVFFDDEIEEMVSDLKISSSYQEVRHIADGIQGADNRTLLSDLEGEFLSMTASKQVYDQLRYIDDSGMEMVRVNYNNGSPYVVPSDELQDEKDRYYVSDILDLREGEIFFSSVDLNIEFGQLEEPYKTIVRIGTPVYSSQGEKKGMVIVNYLIGNVLDKLEYVYSGLGSKVLLANNDGYWMRGISKEDEWGFMLAGHEDRVVKNRFPELWKQMTSGNPVGYMWTDAGLVTYYRFHPLEGVHVSNIGSQQSSGIDTGNTAGNEYIWFIMTLVDNDTYYSHYLDHSLPVIGFFLVLLLIAGLLSWRLYIIMRSRETAESRVIGLLDLLRVINRILRHDIRNRLTRIRWALESSGVSQENEMISEVYKNVDRTLSRIEEMKRLESLSTVHGSSKEVRLSEVIQEIAHAEKINPKIIGDAVVRVDDAIYSVFENFMRNTKKHGGVDDMQFEIVHQYGRAFVTASDEGSGMSDVDPDKLFSEGYMAGSTGNTGLGLYIIKSTVERYGGEIVYEPNQPHGVRFTFDLPLTA